MKISQKMFLYLICLSLSTYITSWFDTLPAKEIAQQNPNIEYKKCFDPVPFDYKPFEADLSYPHKGTFQETFILTIPNGRVQSKYGFSIIDNHFAKELIWANQTQYLQHIPKITDQQVIKVPGRVAVITQICYDCFVHWITEVLGRLALLEMNAVEYDWLYVPCEKSFMKDSLKLWGIDPNKIISPPHNSFCIEADKLIIPSLVINTDIGFKHNGLWTHPYTINYVKNKLLCSAKSLKPNISFPKRIFISRKDGTFRKILNEDNIFELFATKGFKRYELSKMSLIDQILLFSEAEIVVGEHGSGLGNIIYCKPKTKIIELFQALKDASFWYHANVSGLDYKAIKTINFENDYLTAWKANSYVPLQPIQNIIDTILD